MFDKKNTPYNSHGFTQIKVENCFGCKERVAEITKTLN